MTVYRWALTDPWREIRQLQREMNTIFESAFGRREGAMPACNVWTGDEDVLVTCELPGVTMEDLDISVMGDTLTIAGSRKGEDVDRSAYHRRERRTGPFSRSIQLPTRVDPAKVEADYKNGVLNVRLAKAAEEKPRKIEIKSA